jgi:hypothetical protein
MSSSATTAAGAAAGTGAGSAGLDIKREGSNCLINQASKYIKSDGKVK